MVSAVLHIDVSNGWDGLVYLGFSKLLVISIYFTTVTGILHTAVVREVVSN